MAKRQALILAGGKGTRISHLLESLPKPMAPILEKPFLEHLIMKLKREGIEEICLLTGVMAETIRDYFGDGSKFGVNITYSHEDSPLGTGGAIRQAIVSSQASEFIVFNGDSYFDVNLTQVLEESKSSFSVVLAHVDDARRYGLVDVTESGQVQKFREKPQEKVAGLINSGIYLLPRQVIEMIPEGFVSFEKQVLEPMAEKGELYGWNGGDGAFIDIGTPESLAQAEDFFCQDLSYFLTSGLFKKSS